jgi:hypothetical protein
MVTMNLCMHVCHSDVNNKAIDADDNDDGTLEDELVGQGQANVGEERRTMAVGDGEHSDIEDDGEDSDGDDEAMQVNHQVVILTGTLLDACRRKG